MRVGPAVAVAADANSERPPVRWRGRGEGQPVLRHTQRHSVEGEKRVLACAVQVRWDAVLVEGLA